MSNYKKTDKYTWMLQKFSSDFEIAVDEPSALLDLRELILSKDKNFLDDINIESTYPAKGRWICFMFEGTPCLHMRVDTEGKE